MAYYVLKALHIIFMVSYFAGIFYQVRLFVYYKDTDGFLPEKQKILREQYIYMMVRLWNIIIVPAFIIMLITGLGLIWINSSLLQSPWFHLKLFFLIFLFIYQYWCWKTTKRLKQSEAKTMNISNIKLRQYNEIATFLLFLIVFTVILKSLVLTYAWQLMLWFIVLVGLIMLIVKLVNRNKKTQ